LRRPGVAFAAAAYSSAAVSNDSVLDAIFFALVSKELEAFIKEAYDARKSFSA